MSAVTTSVKVFSDGIGYALFFPIWETDSGGPQFII